MKKNNSTAKLIKQLIDNINISEIKQKHFSKFQEGLSIKKAPGNGAFYN